MNGPREDERLDASLGWNNEYQAARDREAAEQDLEPVDERELGDPGE